MLLLTLRRDLSNIYATRDEFNEIANPARFLRENNFVNIK